MDDYDFFIYCASLAIPLHAAVVITVQAHAGFLVRVKPNDQALELSHACQMM